MGLAAPIDDQRDGAHEYKANDQKKVVEEQAACFQLGRWNESQRDGKSRRKDTHRAEQPDPFILKGDFIRPWHVRFGVFQLDGSNEHDDVHDQIALRAEGCKDPKSAADGRHE